MIKEILKKKTYWPIDKKNTEYSTKPNQISLSLKVM